MADSFINTEAAEKNGGIPPWRAPCQIMSRNFISPHDIRAQSILKRETSHTFRDMESFASGMRGCKLASSSPHYVASALRKKFINAETAKSLINTETAKPRRICQRPEREGQKIHAPYFIPFPPPSGRGCVWGERAWH